MAPTLDPDDRIAAHVDLLRAVDQLLSAAAAVRSRRDRLDQILAERYGCARDGLRIVRAPHQEETHAQTPS